MQGSINKILRETENRYEVKRAEIEHDHGDLMVSALIDERDRDSFVAWVESELGCSVTNVQEAIFDELEVIFR